jgi:hypothetical protein
MRILLGTFVTLTLTLSGCTNTEQVRRGPVIDVFPVTYTLSLQTDKNNVIKSRQELASFIEANSEILFNQPVTLFWATQNGLKFKQEAKRELTALGVPSDNIQEQRIDGDANNHFDFQISVKQHKVVVPICKLAKVDNYDGVESGCYTESMRWQSMERPERMIKSPYNSFNTPKNKE